MTGSRVQPSKARPDSETSNGAALVGAAASPGRVRWAGDQTASDAFVEAVAHRVVELLREEGLDRSPRLVDAAELARILGLSRDTVYANAARLGAQRIGEGKRPRLRFDVDRAREALLSGEPSRMPPEGDSPAKSAVRPSRRRARAGTNRKLLPIHDRAEAA